MTNRLVQFWQYLRASFWFVPMLLVLAACALAAGLVELDTRIDPYLSDRWPHIFGVGAEGSRGVLSAIAGSMATIAGVTFSITIVTLSLASQQYTPRILRNFMSDRGNQLVLGVFLAVFAYCLIVLRTIRGGEEYSFVPSVAVLAAIALAFVGLGFLIFFIHHVASSIQASNIIAGVAWETIESIEKLFPEEMGDEPEENLDQETLADLNSAVWRPVDAQTSGYVQNVDPDTLIEFAKQHNTMIQMERAIGEFVVKDSPLVSVAIAGRLEEPDVRKLNGCFTIGRQRTIEQDAIFGIRQLVDIALKALSPGINDPTTANDCLEYLTVILVQLARRRFASHYRMADRRLRVIARGPTFAETVNEAYEQIRYCAAGDLRVLNHLLRSMETVGGAAVSRTRRQIVIHQVQRVAEVVEQSIPYAEDKDSTLRRAREIAQGLEAPYRR